MTDKWMEVLGTDNLNDLFATLYVNDITFMSSLYIHLSGFNCFLSCTNQNVWAYAVSWCWVAPSGGKNVCRYTLKKKNKKRKKRQWFDPDEHALCQGVTHTELYKSTHTWPYKERLSVQMVDQWILALQVCRLNTYLQFVDHFMSNWDIILQAGARAQSPNIF